MEQKQEYSINLDVKFSPLQLIDVPTVAAGVREEWFNQTLCTVNDSVVRLGVFKKGEFHWHKHEKEDEFFFVLEGRFAIDLENESILLEKHQGYLVPKDVIHRTRAPEGATILMMEASTVRPTGD